jgi:16S rRNA (uracil1498-N3)-methyltransferase
MSASPAFSVGSRPQLPASVQRHAFKAMRLAAGDEFQLTDGRGLRVTLRVDDPEAALATVTEVEHEPQPAVRLGLIQALAKGGRDEQAIETSTEIGVDAVMPWQANRSIVQWKGSKASKALAKWEDVLVAATEQSRRAYVPQLEGLHTTRQLNAWIGEATKRGDMVIVLHQDATDTWGHIEQKAAQLAATAATAAQETTAQSASATAGPTIWVIVGPEGGIADEEVASFVQAGAASCVIGTTILRASTAGPVALTLLSHAIGRY